jgi:hypothetical protein
MWLDITFEADCDIPPRMGYVNKHGVVISQASQDKNQACIWHLSGKGEYLLSESFDEITDQMVEKGLIAG